MLMRLKKSTILCVALLAEGVDRNLKQTPEGIQHIESPSSRRAWIEIERLRRGCPL